jgi:ABC-type lipoprotein export system ATPase subunit
VNTIIELKGIGRTYTNSSEPLTVLKNINLKIAAGELVAIIGASGSGKSNADEHHRLSGRAGSGGLFHQRP